jgi:hypothetical protein
VTTGQQSPGLISTGPGDCHGYIDHYPIDLFGFSSMQTHDLVLHYAKTTPTVPDFQTVYF